MTNNQKPNGSPIDKCLVCLWIGKDDDLIETTGVLGEPESVCPQCGSAYVEPIDEDIYEEDEDEFEF